MSPVLLSAVGDATPARRCVAEAIYKTSAASAMSDLDPRAAAHTEETGEPESV